MDATLAMTTALTAVTIGLWAWGKPSEHLTALGFFASAMIFSVAPASVVFSGFASPAFWLVVSGFVLGVAIRKTGLAARAAEALAARLTGSYLGMILGVTALSYGLCFVMPSSMGRIALLMPIVLALADRAGLAPGRPGRIGLALTVGVATFELSCSVLTANVPNLVMVGVVENRYGLHLTYLRYLALHAPVLGLAKGALLVGLVTLLFRDQPTPAAACGPAAPWRPEEKRLGWLLLVTLALWLTDAWHGVSAAWIGLAAACLCMAPKFGVVTPEEFGREVNHRTAFHVAAILGLAALVAYSGLGDKIGRALIEIAPLHPEQPLVSFLALAGLSSGLGFTVTANGVPALYTPLAQSLSAAAGLPLYAALMIQVIGFATPFLPYQAAPIVVAMGLGRVPARAGVTLCAALAALTFLFLAPLSYVWFRLLGAL